MEYVELEKLYKFSVENNISITKHDVKIPSFETATKLMNEYKIENGIHKYIQVLDDTKTVSFVFTIGSDFTLFERICNFTDEYNIDSYKEEEE